MSNDRPNVYPPSSTIITDYLRSTIGLVPGGKFSGRVATITGARRQVGTTWDDAFRSDLDLIRVAGNEHRTIGMWFYHIPTLIEFSHAIRPLFFAVTKNFLARDEDGQRLNILNFRVADIRILRLLGVRYLVTDEPKPTSGVRRILTMPLPGEAMPLALDEISDPNIGVSPIKVTVLKGQDALARLSQSDFDFGTTAILTEDLKNTLQRANDIVMTVERGKLRVQASSFGDSLVVIPFQFSHCLRAYSRHSGDQPILLRADFLLTAILFHGKLDTDIEFRQGPFRGTLCGLNDFYEDRQALSLRNP